MSAASFSNPTHAGTPSEDSPLLGVSREEETSEPTKLSLLYHNLLTGPRVMLTQIGCLMLLVSLMTVILPNPAGLFSYHPPLQAISIILFTQGILTLQPTRTKPDKARGLALHQVFQIAGLLGIAAGVTVMIVNKALHGAKHFASWHGLFGIITASLLVVHAVLGALIAYEPGYKLLGGEDRAKSLWKHHRLSGYLILPLSLLTASLATTKADWVVEHSTVTQRAVMTAGLAIIAVGLWSGASLKKLGFKSE